VSVRVVHGDALGRHGITVDLSRDYCRVAEWRTTDPGQLAKARQEPKPKAVAAVMPVADDGDSLLGDALFDLDDDGGAA